MDLSRLVKVRNGEELKTSSARGLRVSDRKSGTVLDEAISNAQFRKDYGRRIADNGYKPSRLSNISREPSPSAKPKYIVLDSRAISEIAGMTNSQRRNFLSRLSDGERRKVLRALRVNDGLDDGMVKRRDLNRTLEPQDLYVINDLLTKFAYSRKDDELRMLESYKDILDENDGQELAVLTLINKVIDADLDLEADADIIEDAFNFFEDNGFETDSLDASLNAGFGDTVAENGDVLEEEDNFEDEGLDIEGGDLENEELSEDDIDMDAGEEGGGLEGGGLGDESEDEGEEVSLGDSVKEKPVERKRVADSGAVRRESFSNLEPLIIDDSYDLAMSMLKGEVVNVHDSVNNIITKYSERCGEPVRVKDTFDRAFSRSVQQISSYLHGEAQRVKDDIIEQIDEKLGNDSEGEESATILTSLGSALEAFANGDSSELEALSELTLEDIQPEEEEIDTFSASNEENDEKKEEEEEEGDDSFELELSDSAVKAVSLAKALLNNDKSANKIIDELKDEVEVLRKYNFKISDSEIYEPDVIEEVDTIIEPMLTNEEFRSVYQAPSYVGEMAKEINPSECVAVESVNYGDLSPIIQVECNGVCQNWMPIMGSSDKVVEQLNEEGADAAKIISDNCVPVEDYYAAAAKTNNLAAVDSRFYKRKLSDEVWTCDSKPDFIEDDAVEAGAVFAQEGLTTMPKEVPSGSVLIYGTKYNYYNKSKKQ